MLRRLGIGLAVLVASLLVLIVIVVVALQIPPGQRLVVRGLNQVLDGTARIDGLEGTVPFDMAIARVALLDEDEPWLVVEDFVFDWNPGRLLAGVVEIGELSARRIEVAKLPAGEPAPEPEPESDEPFRLPELPESLPLVQLDRLAVDELVLAEPVLGERAVFNVAGGAAAIDQGRALEATLTVERTDQETARVGLDATLALDPPTLNLDLQASETGRLIERLAGLEESGDFELQLVGNGPLRAWRAELDAGGAGIGSLGGVITLALQEQPKAGLDLQVRPGEAILPDGFGELVGETVEIGLDVTQLAAQEVRLDRFRVDAAAIGTTASGAFDFNAQTFDARATVDLPRLAALEPLAGLPLAGRTELQLTAQGPFLQPEGRLEVEGGELALQGHEIANLALALDFEALAELSADPAADLALDGRLEGLVVAGIDLPARDVEIAINASRPPGAPVELNELRIADGNASVTANGSIDPDDRAGSFDLALTVERLGEITAAFGQPIDGRLEVSGPVRLARDAARIASELEVELASLSGLPPDVAPVVGERVTALIEGAFEPGTKASLDRLRLEAGSFEVRGNGNVGLAGEQAITGDLALVMPELAVLEGLAGSDMAGSLALGATLGGNVEVPVVDLQLGGEDLVLAGRPVSRLSLAAHTEGIQPGTGDVDLDVVLPRFEIDLASSYRFDGASVALSDTQLTGPGLDLSGNATVDLASSLTSGRFRGRIEDLARLDALVPLGLKGRVTTDIRLEERNGGQAVTANLEAREVAGPFGAVERTTLEAQVTDALAEPKIQANLALNDFRQDENRVERLDVQARGGLAELTVDLSTAGTAAPDIAFDLEGRTVLGLEDLTRVRLERLDGSLGGQPLRLEAPATVIVDGADIRLQDLDLRFAGGRLTAAVDIGPGPVSGQVRIDGLPLANLEPLGAPALAGTFQAALDLSGDAANPALTLNARIPNLRSPDPSLGDVPPLDLALEAALADQRLEADLRAGGLTDAPISADVALPVQANLADYAFAAPETGELAGGLRADIRLRRIADLLALDGQRLEGRLEARVDLAGTVGEPAFEGQIALDDGLYENGATGTVLRGIRLRANADTERLVLNELSATDGGDGRLSGSGEVGLAGDYPIDVGLEMRNAMLVRRDDARVTLGGDMGVRGNLERSTVGGEIVVERAEISLPDPSSGPDIATLTVEEVGNGFGTTETEEAPEEADQQVVVLDLTIRVPGRFYVRGRGLESEWTGRLQIEGTADEPSLVGNLEIKRGNFDFLDQRFALDEGTIGFTGGLPPTPEIDIRAVAEAEDITAIVHATGTPDDLEIRLTSDPVLPEDEVLSRLLFNRDLASISPVEAASLAMAVNRLRGGSGGSGGLDVLGRARRALGVDTLDVGGGPDGETVKAGKYLSDDVYVEVEKGQAAESGRARVELEVLPNVSLEADVGEDQRSGVGVKWKYDF